MFKKKVAILGSTGSIGKSSLEIFKADKSFSVFLLATNKNFREILKQIKFFKPKILIVSNFKIFKKVKNRNKFKNLKIFNNYKILKKIKNKIDITISAIPGIAGLEPTLKFIKISKKILIANKESIICGWNLIEKVSKKYNTKLIPIDSEHYSISQLTKNFNKEDIVKIYITASGGPFLNLNLKKFSSIKPENAIKHPKWKMGKKISIDSATLVNKVLEVSEATKLFPFKLDTYKIIIHPESLVHAIIQLKNGIKYFLYHEPDMKIPIASALNSNYFFLKNKRYKKKLFQIKDLNFEEVDKKKFPIINLIPKINSSKSSLIVFNALNEIFVDQFLKKNIDFIDITRYLKLTVNDIKFKHLSKMNCNNLKNIYKIDHLSRKLAYDKVKKKGKNVL
jgi:1-deoxy-D-xylulose-5-phosphate reductoisomerase